MLFWVAISTTCLACTRCASNLLFAAGACSLYSLFWVMISRRKFVQLRGVTWTAGHPGSRSELTLPLVTVCSTLLKFSMHSGSLYSFLELKRWLFEITTGMVQAGVRAPRWLAQKVAGPPDRFLQASGLRETCAPCPSSHSVRSPACWTPERPAQTGVGCAAKRGLRPVCCQRHDAICWPELLQVIRVCGNDMKSFVWTVTVPTLKRFLMVSALSSVRPSFLPSSRCSITLSGQSKNRMKSGSDVVCRRRAVRGVAPRCQLQDTSS